jgi:CheY-like chemotaxis protein
MSVAESASGEVAILYIEDEPDDVWFMRAAFERCGLSVQLCTVSDGQQAIAYLAGEPPFHDRTRHPLPTVVLLDLNLPLRSGFEVLRWIRAQPGLQKLTVIVFSSSGRTEDRRKAAELGASHYTEKPTSGVQFREVANDLKQRWLAAGGAG